MDHRWVLWWITGKYLWSRMGHFLRSRLRGTDEFEQELAKENLILREAAGKLGIEVIDHGGGMLEFRRGERRSFIKGNATELESAVAHRIAGDKFLVSRILAENGLPVPTGTCFTVDEVERAREYFHHAEKPLVVKPRRGTSGGVGVTAGIESWRDFRRAFFEAGMYDRYVLVERFVSGEHIRLLMIKDQLLSAVRRVPAFVIGDGRRSIRRLIQETNRRRAASQQFPRLWPIRINNDLKLTLRRQSLTLRSVPPAGQKVYVKTICNGHQGGIVEEVTRIIHPAYVRLAARALQLCKTAFAGVDVITGDVTRPPSEAGAVINEINTTPSFYGHYQASNQEEVQYAAEKFLRYLFQIPEEGGR